MTTQVRSTFTGYNGQLVRIGDTVEYKYPMCGTGGVLFRLESVNEFGHAEFRVTRANRFHPFGRLMSGGVEWLHAPEV